MTIKRIPFLFLFIITLVGFLSFSSVGQGWIASLDTGNAGYWKLDDTSGAVIDSARGNNGSVTAGVFRGKEGLLNNSFNFTGVASQAVLLGNLSNMTGTNTFTYSLWFNNTGTGGAGFGYPLVLGADRVLVAVSSTTTFAFVDTSTGSLQSNTVAYSRHRWVHVVVTYNASDLNVYINGTLNSTVKGGGTVILTNTTLRLGGGSSGTGNQFYGSLDEVGFWNRTLTQSEITTLYNSGAGLAYKAPVEGEGIDVVLVSPPDAIQTINRTLNFSASQLSGTALNHTNITFYIWNSAGTILNRTTFPVVGGNGTTQTANLLNVNFSSGSYSWNAFGCGKNQTQKANCTFAPTNFSFQITDSEEIARFFEASKYETSNTTFISNISVVSGATFYTANLVYNGTSLKADTVTNLGGGQFQLIKTLDIPGVNANTTKNFYWEITADTGSGFTITNTSVQLQNISITNITSLDIGRASINYSLYDEDTLVRINATMDATHSWYLGSGTERENNSFALGLNSSFIFRDLPSFVNFHVDSDIELQNSSTANNIYEGRQFNFVGEKFAGNLTKEQPLYLLKGSNGTNVVFEVKDSGLAPLENYLVKVYRFYASTNTYRMVESKQTDLFGQITVRLVENTVKYKIEFYDENNNLVKTVDNVFVVCRNAVCSQQFIVEDDTNFFELFNNLTNYEYTFTFNNNSNTFTFIWNDQRGQSQTHYLEVKRRLFNGTTEICNSTTTSSTSKVGSLSCGVGSSRASYEAQAFRRVGTETRRIAVLNVKVGDLSGTFGTEGLIWSVILLGTMILIGSYNPPIGVGLYLLGVFVLGLFDILYINPAIMIAEIVIGVLFIWAFRG